METVDTGDLEAVVVTSARELVAIPVVKRSEAFRRMLQKEDDLLLIQIGAKLLSEPNEVLRVMNRFPVTPPAASG